MAAHNGTTNLVIVSLEKSVENIMLMSCEPCDPSNCIKSFPKECKYYRNYKRCKFNPCKFLNI